jgi:hypothetical protein
MNLKATVADHRIMPGEIKPGFSDHATTRTSDWAKNLTSAAAA